MHVFFIICFFCFSISISIVLHSQHLYCLYVQTFASCIKNAYHSQYFAFLMIQSIIIICFTFVCLVYSTKCRKKIFQWFLKFEFKSIIYFTNEICYLLVLFQWSDVPSPFKDCSTSLENSFGGRYEATFCAPAQLLPDAESVGTTLPTSDTSVNVFEKQHDSTAEVERDVSAPPTKKSRHCPHTPSDLRGLHLQPHLSSERVSEEAQDEQASQKAAEMGESSSSEEQAILPQHSALCVC